MPPKKSIKVLQSNKLVEARYRLTLQEKRFVLWLLSQIKPDDIKFKKYEISVKDFANMMGFNIRTQYKEMKDITARLITRLIQLEDEKTGKIIQLAWLAFAEWDPAGGTCVAEFHPELKPHLLQLREQFTQIGFADLLGLGSTYSVRLLEILAQYESIGSRTTTIEDIRLWCGINKDEYQKYNHLKTRVIDRAKEEINEKTDYDINYKEIKKSRRVERLDWTISKKNNEKEQFNHRCSSKVKVDPTNICNIPEIINFCKLYDYALPKVNYLLNVTHVEILNNVLILSFPNSFFLSQCDNPLFLERLKEFFKTNDVEFLVNSEIS